MREVGRKGGREEGGGRIMLLGRYPLTKSTIDGGNFLPGDGPVYGSASIEEKQPSSFKTLSCDTGFGEQLHGLNWIRSDCPRKSPGTRPG